MVIQLIDPIRIQYWIHVFMRWSFQGGEITELAANIIAESMYAQCGVNGNEYLLSEAFIHHRNKGSTLSVEDQKGVIKGLEMLRKLTVGWDICYKLK